MTTQPLQILDSDRFQAAVKAARDRFDHLDHVIKARLQSDELVDRDLTLQTRASIRIVLGRLADFAQAP